MLIKLIPNQERLTNIYETCKEDALKRNDQEFLEYLEKMKNFEDHFEPITSEFPEAPDGFYFTY